MFVHLSGIAALNSPGFKDTALQDFLFIAAQTRADSLPATYKGILLMTAYVRVSMGPPTTVYYRSLVTRSSDRCAWLQFPIPNNSVLSKGTD